ncbi:ATP-binding protein [Peribacillus asahii]|uniref:histidine kinase n=1 Tax=Peribacillus asahii TaxID=228899 RepID=A0A3T0KQL4_9BACI|nr:ATP-binding protein [Peribacillus asahii]AZV42752.1 sensor histidine kinase [Peribacillus asahii]USK86997.1 two-component sensor histidine kinase [Peribacillus asahii]
MYAILINVLFLLVVLLITQHIIEIYTKKLTRKLIKIYSFLAGLISIFFCMTFPFSVNEGFIVDIRIVPFIMASLYGGPLVSVGLYVFIVLYRFVIGVDFGFWGTILNYSVIPLLTFICFKRFIKSETTHKLLISLSVITFHLSLSYFIYSNIFVSHTPLNITLLGNLIKIICIILCVFTLERIRLNYQIRNKIVDIEKMEILSHLSASISHEIRNGLTGAKGFMQLLKENESDLQKQKYIGIALDELERSEIIIRDFLTFAKPAPEKIEKINMEHFLNYIIELVSPISNMNSIKVKKSLSPFWIIGDRRIIQQAFLNIFKNAIEAMPNGGQLVISMNSHKNMYEISIEDTGVGMDREQIERLGKPYFTTKGQKGTGLGMMVAYRVIEELNGKIKVTSQIGKGTTFTIYLPRSFHNSENVIIDPSVCNVKHNK